MTTIEESGDPQLDEYVRRLMEAAKAWQDGPLRGIGGHLKVVNNRGEVVIDEDVNCVEVTVVLRWETWEAGQKDVRDRHELSLSDLASIEITPFSGRLRREPVGGS